MTTTPISGRTDSTPRRGFTGIRCPLCGSVDAMQSMDLRDLHAFHCAGCDEDYKLEDVRSLLASWQHVLDWIDAELSID